MLRIGNSSGYNNIIIYLSFHTKWYDYIGSCNVKLLYSHNHKPKDCKTVDFANFGDFN